MKHWDLWLALRDTAESFRYHACRGHHDEATLEAISAVERTLRALLDRAKLDAMHHEKSTPTYGDHEQEAICLD